MKSNCCVLAIVALALSGCQGEAPSSSGSGLDAPVQAPRKFYNDANVEASAECKASLEHADQRSCTLTSRMGVDQFQTSIQLLLNGDGVVTGGEIVLGFETATTFNFYGQRCDAYPLASGSCPGSGRYRLLIREEGGPLVEIWSRRLVPNVMAPTPPTFVLDGTSPSLLDAIADSSKSRRAELQFVPDDPSTPQMVKSLDYLVPAYGPLADIAFGYELVSKGRYAPGSYGT